MTAKGKTRNYYSAHKFATTVSFGTAEWIFKHLSVMDCSKKVHGCFQLKFYLFKNPATSVCCNSLMERP